MDAYRTLAAAYGTLTAEHDYDRWLDEIERLARDAGLRGNRLLGVACGTGSSFLPLRDRYEIVGCDLSPAMLRHAAERAGGDGVRLLRHDMRALPVLGSFDLVLCLDDSINHLLEPDDVRAALRGMAANLAPGGVVVFDVNTLATFRAFSGQWVIEDDRHLLVARGTDGADVPPGARASVKVDVLSRVGELYSRDTVLLTERHYPVGQLLGFLADAGLEAVQVLGQSTGVRLEDSVDELRHSKALFVARHRAAAMAPARAA